MTYILLFIIKILGNIITILQLMIIKYAPDIYRTQLQKL